jgi:hypothetical protein
MIRTDRETTIPGANREIVRRHRPGSSPVKSRAATDNMHTDGQICQRGKEDVEKDDLVQKEKRK